MSGDTAAGAEALGELRVLEASGAPFRLGDLWRDRPAVLFFIRHFG